MKGFDETKALDGSKICGAKTISVIARIIEYTAGFLFFLSLCVAAYEVLMRYVFKQPHDWGDELTMFLMLWSVFLGASLALREGKITIVDVVPQMLKPRPRIVLLIVISITTIITCAAFFWSGCLVVHTFFIRGCTSPTSLEIPFWLTYLILPTSMGLCTLFEIHSVLKLKAELSASVPSR